MVRAEPFYRLEMVHFQFSVVLMWQQDNYKYNQQSISSWWVSPNHTTDGQIKISTLAPVSSFSVPDSGASSL